MKRELRYWLIRLLILVVLLVGVVMIHWRLSALRQTLLIKQQQVQQAPVEELAAASLRSELRRSQADIAEALRLLPTRGMVVDVVTAIEQAGKERGITAAVLDIEEHEDSEQTKGAMEEVELQVSATGSPAELLEFLYEVEHLPYVLHGKDWRLLVGGGQSQLGKSGLLAPTGGPAVVPPQDVATLRATIVLAVRAEVESL